MCCVGVLCDCVGVRAVFCGTLEDASVWIQNASVCTLKTSPCVRATRSHALSIWTCCRQTRKHFECTHEGVAHAGGGRRRLRSREGGERKREEERQKEPKPKICSWGATSCHVHHRFTKSNRRILSIWSLKVGGEQRAADSTDHSCFLLKAYQLQLS